MGMAGGIVTGIAEPVAPYKQLSKTIMVFLCFARHLRKTNYLVDEVEHGEQGS